MKRYILLIVITGASIIANYTVAQQSPNYFFDDWKPKIFRIPEKTERIEFESGNSNYSVSIFQDDTIAPVLATQLGLNTTFRSGTDMVKKRLDNYRFSKMKAFRFPAGSGSNIYFWDGNTPDDFLIDFNPIDGTKSKNLNIEEFVAFIDSIGAEATIVVNYFYARYGKTASGTREARVNQAAEYAAGFVGYVNNTLKAGVKNWEIGNECYGKWETGYDVNGSIVTGKEYGEDLRVFAEKMKAVDPTIKIGAVMYSKSGAWNTQVMKEVKNAADFLVVHNYFTGEKDATPENILASTVQIGQIKKTMEECTTQNTSHPKDYFPVATTEYNCRGPHTTTFINACFTADVLGRFMENRYGMATRWVGEWKWKVGTHGLFAVSDPDQADYTVRQAYWIYKYFGENFGDYLVESSTSNSKITVYTSKFSDGKTGLVVINATANEQEFNLKMANDSTGKVWMFEVYANSIAETDKKFYVNGFTSTTIGGGPDVALEIPPFVSNFQPNTIFNVRKYSVSYFVFETSPETSSNSLKENFELKVYPNPTKSKLYFESKQKFTFINIYNSRGEKVVGEQFKNPFDISFLPPEIYFLTLHTPHITISKKVLKE
ncbi:MAG: T9SS type A sorting domain-containing protein [Draconibacterium sp.]|nr:T9SS type A sorting domain-containing protein [Draconibacterium sp.]